MKKQTVELIIGLAKAAFEWLIGALKDKTKGRNDHDDS